MHERRPESSRNPTVLTRPSSPSSTEATFARALCSLATVTTRNTAASDSGASMLCASIGTLSQFLPDIPNSPLSQSRISRSQAHAQHHEPFHRPHPLAALIPHPL